MPPPLLTSTASAHARSPALNKKASHRRGKPTIHNKLGPACSPALNKKATAEESRRYIKWPKLTEDDQNAPKRIQVFCSHKPQTSITGQIVVYDGSWNGSGTARVSAT